MSTAVTLESIADIEVGNLAALNAALAQMDSDSQVLDVDPDNTPKGEATPEPKAKAPEAKVEASAPPGAKEDDTPTGISTKNGKGVIPYNVLTDERKQRQAAEARSAELEQALNDMKEKTKGAPTDTATDAAALFTPEELVEIEQDFPALKKLTDAYSKQAETIKQLNDKVEKSTKTVETHTRSAQEEADDDARAHKAEAVSAAKTGRTLLTKWEKANGGLWAEAIALDAELKDSPEWDAASKKTLADRFAEVERRIAEKYDIPTPKPPASAVKAEVIERQPQSLSDLPGRTPIAEVDAVNAMGTQELHSKFDGMTNDQINAFLARAG